MSETIEGGCLCGACRYASSGPALNSRICHCRRCQRATGSAFYARIMVPRSATTISGPIGWFDAGTEVVRGFCTRCGSTLFTERPSAGTIGLAAGSLDDPACFAPTAQIWVSRRQPWFKLDDALPAHEEAPPG